MEYSATKKKKKPDLYPVPTQGPLWKKGQRASMADSAPLWCFPSPTCSFPGWSSGTHS